ncbi:unnamed protein product [Spirodela intermedia]|uniref:RING-CH-type domain-containing protein n=1 Tax=Spirodela intermedia TaxID=51605 RepID=A0A7I8JC15_SPIIN|nr:unnamed protein product [Spirodela intermedia]CAA6667728.1 unnamed protein product [Spirodela intermedia]
MIECKICQEEGEEGDMEAPCACSGTIKFAHRKCVERWCNKKGNIICEICNQAYAPNYSVPRKDCMTIDIRQGWGPQIDLDAPHFFAIAAAEQQFLHVEYDDFSVSNTSGVLCCRYMAFMLLLLLIIRQALMLTGESGTLRNLSILVNVSFILYLS